MTDKQYKQVHTTIPEKYHNYAKDKKLSWAELLIKSIELEMKTDPEIIETRLLQNSEEREQLLKNLKLAKKTTTEKKARLKDLHKGLIPVD